MTVELDVHDTPDEAAGAAGEALAAAAHRGGHVALSGGSTPGPAYERAAVLQLDWSAVGVWWADERCVPPADERSNFRLVRETLLDRLEGQPRAVHRVLGELEPKQAADRYDRELHGVALDLALLGIGDDGHTASLFPNADALWEEQRLAVAVERPDVARVTMTPPPLRAAALVVFLAVGADKADAVARAFGDDPDPATPASMIRGRRTVAILDQAAAAELY